MLAPGLWKYWYWREIGQKAVGNPFEALKDYDSAARLEPTNAEVMSLRAAVHSALVDLEGTVADHGTAIVIDPENVNALNGGVWNFFLLDRNLEVALADAQNADVLDPEFFEIADTMADVLSGLDPANLGGLTPPQGYDNGLRIGGAKLVLDGSTRGKTAWMTEPYVSPPGRLCRVSAARRRCCQRTG